MSHDDALGWRQTEVLTGLMLGDGCLTLGRNSRNAVLQITRSAVDLAYQHWTAEVFTPWIASRGLTVRDVPDARTGKTYRSAVLRTRSAPVFTGARQYWYPDGRKQVPADLHLTALAVAVWFADDGSVTVASRRSPDLKFATQGFSGEEVSHLRDALARRYDAQPRVYSETNGQQTIRMFGADAKALLRDIDSVFPPMSRKSDRWRLTEVLFDKEPTPDCPRCSAAQVYRWAKTARGVQKFKCMACMRVFLDEYERPWRDPRKLEAIGS